MNFRSVDYSLKNTSLGILSALALAACSDSETEVAEVENFGADPVMDFRLEDVLNQRGEGQYTLFESGHVRPLAMSDNGQWLFAVNTSAGMLEILETNADGLSPSTSVQVGLEPVAVAAYSDEEVWVVNHLSDSVSIVRNTWDSWHVVNTLLVGDEPRDIVFTGSGLDRMAYITTAHRGQNVPYDPQFTVPGVGRGDVWVFNGFAAGSSDIVGGEPETIINLFSDSPRALATDSHGSVVYAAGFLTGNQTTVIPEETVTTTMGLPEPTTNVVGEIQPPTSLIVKYQNGDWVDELGRSWADNVYFTLPDKDVFTIDSTKSTPLLVENRSIASVGTNLFNMAVHPTTGEVFVSNTDARNEERFEGPGEFAGHTLRGRFIENRMSIIDEAGQVKHRNLNKHIDSSVPCCDTAQPETQAKSLAMPTDLVFNDDGSTRYVAATSSSKVGVFETEKLRDDSFEPSAENHIFVEDGGPSGLVYDGERNRLYVMSRFGNSISVVDTTNKSVESTISLTNFEPEHIVNGRRFLYDANVSSANGGASCGSCHVFGDLDSLAWDLGAPDSAMVVNPGPFKLHPQSIGIDMSVDFAALNGPTTTQSLRGMANHGSMHWRGDRTGGNAEMSAQPDSGSFDERAAFETFNEAFVGLNGNEEVLSHD